MANSNASETQDKSVPWQNLDNTTCGPDMRKGGRTSDIEETGRSSADGLDTRVGGGTENGPGPGGKNQ